jgi:hypothetical protein
MLSSELFLYVGNSYCFSGFVNSNRDLHVLKEIDFTHLQSMASELMMRGTPDHAYAVEEIDDARTEMRLTVAQKDDVVVAAFHRYPSS